MRMQPVPPDAKIVQLGEIAKIQEAARAAFAQNLTAAIALANRRGPDYRSPNGALPILSDAEAVSAAALALLNAIAACGAETKADLQSLVGLCIEGNLDDRIAAIDDLYAASETIILGLNYTSDGKPRKRRGRPSTEIGEPGLSAGELFAFEAFVLVKHAGGWLALNEHESETGRDGLSLGGSAKIFFGACKPLLPGITLPNASRLKDLRAKAETLGKSRAE